MKKSRKLLLTVFVLFTIQASIVYGQDTIKIKEAIWYPSSSMISENGGHVMDSILNIVNTKPILKIEVIIVEYIKSKSSRCFAKPRAKSILDFFTKRGVREDVIILKYNCEIRDERFFNKNSLPYLFSIVHY